MHIVVNVHSMYPQLINKESSTNICVICYEFQKMGGTNNCFEFIPYVNETYWEDGIFICNSEAKSKEKHGVWDPMPELTIYNLSFCPLQSRLQHI
jgi:hypothetical protein